MLLTFFILAAPAAALAAFTCASIHSHNQSPREFPGLYEKLLPSDIPELAPKIEKMILGLLDANREALADTSDGDLSRNGFTLEGTSAQWKISHMKISSESTDNYQRVDFMLDTPGRKYGLTVRSNGRFTFLSSTYLYRSNDQRVKHYKAVYLENDEIKVVDQGQAILASLPETMILSRNLGPEEHSRWLTGQPFQSRFGQKVHFAPFYFEFRGKPYQIKISKEDLLQLYAAGLLEINVYDAVNLKRAAVSMVLPPVGLEFELVFTGKAAVDRLAPMMQRDLATQPVH